MLKQKVKYERGIKEDRLSANDLILYNDEVNTFDFVIDSLVDVCEHNPLQAEQCTLIVHLKGKCTVKSGCFTDLKPKFDELSRRGLTASIE